VFCRHYKASSAFAVAMVFFALAGSIRAEDGLFGAIINLLSGGRVQPVATAPENNPSSALDPFALIGTTVKPSEGTPAMAYCVRTCDGRYFPLPKNVGGAKVTPANVCSALCPKTETKIFNGNNIENSISSDGKKYSRLPNAFVYREKLVGGCSCNGRDISGTAAIDIMQDPTLRSGDIVITLNGPVVFEGKPDGKHKISDFVPASRIAGSSASMKEKVAAMKAMPIRRVYDYWPAVDALALLPNPVGPAMSFTSE